jgi:type VI secretion system protein ImpK
MSDKKNGAGNDDEKTVFRPNPGGRRPPANPRTPGAPGGFVDPSAAPFGSAGGGDDWFAGRSAAPPPSGALPHAQDLHFEELAAPNANPIMRSAGPLLLLLGRLRVAALRASFASLMEQVVEAVKFFEKDIRAAGVPSERAEAAKYLICATADDIVQNIPTEDRHVWAQYSMLSRFFGERTGGVRFFDELDRLLADPVGNYDVLELQHACIALGFQGKYRYEGGAAALQGRQRLLYETLRRIRPRPTGAFSPHWQGQKLALRRKRFTAPAWAIAGVILLAAMVGFFFLRAKATAAADQVATEIEALHPHTKMYLQRRLPAPPPKITPSEQQLTQVQRIRAALAPEIAAGAVTVDPDGEWIAIRVGNLILFKSGEATVMPDFLPVAQRIGQMLEHEVGPLEIVGHTDNVPLGRTNRFKSNFQLSVERAKAVAALIAPLLSKPDRIKVEGKGADEPIASNATAAGRAKNRRVEILVTKAE